MKRINLLHPFSAKAAGVIEESIPEYHSQIHAKVLNKLAEDEGYNCKIDYFTQRLRFYNIKKNELLYRFFPLSYDLKGDYKKFRKQKSFKCFKNYTDETPDITIINMSAHSSLFSYEISKIILAKGKKYIAMLGGQHFSDNKRNREYYANADHILVHTKSFKNILKKENLFKDLDIRFFPLGVDTGLFKPDENINKYSSGKKIKLLYVGMIVERKRIHISIGIVLELIKNGFDNICFDIIGPIISNSYFLELNSLIKKNNLEANINFINQLPYKDLIPYYQAADLFLFPSDRETFGMVIIEAMACGTPVAAINCLGGPSEVIKHNINGMLTSLEDYSLSILKYFGDPTNHIQIKKNAIQTVLNDYSLKNTYTALQKSIND
jgi:glycosyltransferase involved in cell wall biosynthesis